MTIKELEYAFEDYNNVEMEVTPNSDHYSLHLLILLFVQPPQAPAQPTIIGTLLPSLSILASWKTADSADKGTDQSALKLSSQNSLLLVIMSSEVEQESEMESVTNEFNPAPIAPRNSSSITTSSNEFLMSITSGTSYLTLPENHQ